MSPRRKPFATSRVLVLAAIAFLSLSPGLVPSARAAEERARLDNSVQAVPADAAFYLALLRNREQIEAVLNSKAWAKLMELPAAQMLREKLKSEMSKPGADWAKFKAVLDKPEVHDALELLGDMVSEEIFVYGDERWADVVRLYGQMFSRAFQAGLKTGALQKTGETEKAANAAMLELLKENVDRLQVPDLVIGFRVTKKELGRAQLNRLEKLLRNAIAEHKPEYKDRLQRKKIAGDEFLTFSLTGKDMDVAKGLRDLGGSAGDLDAVVKKLNGLKVTYAIGIRGNYLLLAMGQSSEVVAKFSQGKRLIDRPELKPLLQFGDRRLTSIGYASKTMRTALNTTKKDVDGWIEMAEDLLKQSQLPADQQARIRKDIHELGKDVKGFIPEHGPFLSFSFLNGRGHETYQYDWSEHPSSDGSKPLTLLNHVGGSPLVAVVGRSSGGRRFYDFLVKWVKVANGYFEDYAVTQMPPAEQAKYQQFVKEFHPLVRQFDQATSKLLLPALADGQSAFVLDAKLKSKQWIQLLPPTDQPMPMLEPAFVLGVSDDQKLRQAFGEYRAILNKIIDHLREAEPKVPNFQIPPPEERKLKAGDLYYYPLPPLLGLDQQILPNAGLSSRVAVLSLSQGHTERLLSRTPLKVSDGPLADSRRPLAGATYVDWPGIVDALTPWIEFGVRMAVAKGRVPAAKGDGKPKDDGQDAEGILKQVRTVLEVLKVLRRYTSVTYVEQGALVTHGETVIQDLGDF